VLLATQSSDDLMRTELLRVVLESCPTVCFLANPQIDRRLYQDLFHLTETEAERITTIQSRRQFLLKQPGVAKVLTLNVDPESAWLFGSGHADASKVASRVEPSPVPLEGVRP
jgi:type IV secretion system protein VirB4